ncbi:MAG: hypothetical protein AAGA91_00305 [Pseudomonadota bacterium]
MNKLLVTLGSIAGLAGVLACLVSALARIAGQHYMLGFQSTTVFNVGVGLMVFACLIKLEQIASRSER